MSVADSPKYLIPHRRKASHGEVAFVCPERIWDIAYSRTSRDMTAAANLLQNAD